MMLFKSIIFFVATFFLINDNGVCIKFAKKNNGVKADPFGNVYVIGTNEISKYNYKGILQKTFSNKRYGKISFLDVTNPLKILVYYKDFQQIVFLDDQLTLSNNPISLENLGYEQTSLVCSSMNNSFWLYNNQNNELVRYSKELKPLVKTGNLKQILQSDIKPNFIKEHNGNLYLNCPSFGILVFDIYGTFSKTIPLKNLKEFDVVNGNIFYFENNTLKEYQLQTFNTIEKQFTDTLIKTVYWNNSTFYKVYADSLIIQP